MKNTTKAKQKYNNSHYDRIELHVMKGKKETYKKYAESKDKSLNAFITELIEEKIKSEN